MVGMMALKCPECGAKLKIEEGRKQCYCQYCGHKILLDDGSINVNVTRTYHKVDDARLKEAEVDKLVRLKELEVEEKKMDRKARNRSFRAKLGVVLLLVGAVSIIIARILDDDGAFSFGFFAIVGALLVGFFAIFAD